MSWGNTNAVGDGAFFSVAGNKGTVTFTAVGSNIAQGPGAFCTSGDATGLGIVRSATGNGISISGNECVVDGKKYVLPPYHSVSVDGNVIVLDGKVWDPNSQSGEAKAYAKANPTRKSFILGKMDAPEIYHVSGVGHVTLRASTSGKIFGEMIVSGLSQETMDQVRFNATEVYCPSALVLDSTLVLYVPSDLKKLHVSGAKMVFANGVELPGLDVFTNVSSVDVTHCSFQSWNHESGPFAMNHTTCPSLSIATLGDNVIVAYTSARMLNAKSHTGSISLIAVTGAMFSLQTKTGEIELTGCSCEQGTAETTTGKVYVNAGNLQRFRVKTTTGPFEGEGSSDVLFRTNTGEKTYKFLKGESEEE